MGSERPPASSDAVRRRMRAQRRRDTAPEIALRKELFALGLRFRVAYPVPGLRRRSIDIAFPKRRVAIFVDGCFWHGCPLHGVQPKSSSEWWRAKLAANMARDAETEAHLTALGWRVIRLWEHDAIPESASRILASLHPDSGHRSD